eukprot:11200_1
MFRYMYKEIHYYLGVEIPNSDEFQYGNELLICFNLVPSSFLNSISARYNIKIKHKKVSKETVTDYVLLCCLCMDFVGCVPLYVACRTEHWRTYKPCSISVNDRFFGF